MSGRPTTRRKLDSIGRERQRESTLVSVLVSNFLHDLRLLDPTALAARIGSLTVDGVIDGDIPTSISLHKATYGGAWIEWRLWPDDLGASTRGEMEIFRASATSASLDVYRYRRSLKRSARLARIVVPDAKWGLSSTELTNLGIATTY